MTKAAVVVIAIAAACASENAVHAPPAAPQMGTDGRWIVAPTALGDRLAGERDLVPDSDEKTILWHASTRRILTVVQFCLDEAGAVQEARTIVASPLPRWDASAVRLARAWRFHPFVIDGKLAVVCSAFPFVYTQN